MDALIRFKKNVSRLALLEEHPFLPLLFILGLSILIKAVLIFQADIINDDGIRYVNAAHELFQGNIAAAFVHEKMLGFVLLLGLTHAVVPDWFLAGKLLSSAALIVTTIPLYFLAQQLFGRRAALLTATAFTVAPIINDKCTAVIKDPLFLCLAVLSLCLMLLALEKSRWCFSLAAGFLCLFSVLVRPEGSVLFLVVAMFLGILAVFLPQSRSLNLKLVAAFCLPTFTASMIAIIMFISGAIAMDTLPGIHEKFAYYFQLDVMNNYKVIYQHLKEVEENFPGGQWSNDFFESARGNICLIYLFGLMQSYGKLLFPVFVIPLIWGLRLESKWNRQLVLFLTVLTSFLLMDYLYLLSRNYLSGRYLLLPVVLGFVLVGHGMDRISISLSNLRFRKTAFTAVLILCVLLPVGRAFVKVSHEKEEIKAAGVWLRDNRNMAHTKLIVSDERIAFYAGLYRGAYDTFQDNELNQLREKTLHKDYDLVVAYRNKATMDETPDLKGFSFIKDFAGNKKVALIYEKKT